MFLNAFSQPTYVPYAITAGIMRRTINVDKKTEAEVTVAQQLYQGTAQGMGCFHSLLEFSLFLSFFQEKERKMTVVVSLCQTIKRLTVSVQLMVALFHSCSRLLRRRTSFSQ